MFHSNFSVRYRHSGGRFYIPERADAVVDIRLHDPPSDFSRYIVDMGYATMIVRAEDNWCLPHAIPRYSDHRVPLRRTSLNIWNIPCDVTIEYARISSFDGLELSLITSAALTRIPNLLPDGYTWDLGYGTELEVRTSGTRVTDCWMDQGRVATTEVFPKQKI